MACCDGYAASGDADPSFGTHGITIVDFSGTTGLPGNVTSAATAVDAQARTWGAAIVQGSLFTEYLGLMRLTPNGALDATFGTGGVSAIVLPEPTVEAYGYKLAALRIGADGAVYIGYSQTNLQYTTEVRWYACRISDAGAFDPVFFGGCVGVVQPGGLINALLNDLEINPQDGSVWLLGAAQEITPPFPPGVISQQFPAFASFDPVTNIVRTGNFYEPSQDNIVPYAGAFDNSGNLFFSGSDYVPPYYIGTVTHTIIGQADVLFDSINSTNVWLKVPYAVNSADDSNTSPCLAVTPDAQIVAGVELYVSPTYNWASARAVVNSGYIQLDGSYGAGGKTHDVIALSSYSTLPDYTIVDCSLGADGALNLVGSYTFTDPTANVKTTALAIHRLSPGGPADQSFGGGDSAVPGVGYVLAYAGSVLDYLRPPGDPLPRKDVPVRVSSVVPFTGTMIIGAMSQRTDGSQNSDLAVLRVLVDDIFNGGFEIQ